MDQRLRVCRSGSSLRRWRHGRAAAFTMIEIILVVAILSLLVGMMVLNVGNLLGSGDLDEGAQQAMSLLESARAEAGLRGRRIRMDFEPAEGHGDLMRVRVSIEKHPVSAPGEFEPLEATWTRFMDDDVVMVHSITLVEQSRLKHLVGRRSRMTDDDQPPEIPSLDFYPDRTSDSAVLILVQPDHPESEAAVIEIDWLTGPSKPWKTSLEQALEWLNDRSERFGGGLSDNPEGMDRRLE
ncbi:MAG: hypothetical protein JJU36_01030 [Phycisphaeraceae bacterium]|nr:hypothetical protein [Phycisphaeraceae bacterium]